MLALCARYQQDGVGVAANCSQSRTACDDGSPRSPPASAIASHPSRSNRSFTARHQTLPDGDASSGSRRPRWACQRMNESAARRNGRCRGARPVGPWNSRSISARRAAGSSRTAATWASTQSSASRWPLTPGQRSAVQAALTASSAYAEADGFGRALPLRRDRRGTLLSRRSPGGIGELGLDAADVRRGVAVPLGVDGPQRADRADGARLRGDRGGGC